MKRFALPAIIVFGLAFLVSRSVTTGPDAGAYAAEINQYREERLKYFRNDPGSPFRGQEDAIDRLDHYPPDLAYKVTAKLEPVKEKKVRLLTTSTGQEERYLDYAWAVFEIDEKEQRLLILEIMDMGPNRGKLFLAFADETSARETYGGGRYLDLKKVPGATSLELDFNKAYNPYCAYNEEYSCPLPPSENVLAVGIPAGEKNLR